MTPNTNRPAELVSEGAVNDYQNDGVVVLRGVFRDWVDTLRAGIERNIAAPSPLERTYRPDDGSAPFFQDYCSWARIPEYRAFVLESPAAQIAARLMRSRIARFFHDHVLVKEPGNSMATPWHQDQPYYCVEGRQSVSFWIPLDPVARDTVMECIAGSHSWGKDFRPTRFSGVPLYQKDEFEPLPDIEANRSAYRILGWDVEPGDAIAFHFRTVHGAPANRTARRRRVLSARWVGEDAVFARRAGTTSPPFPDLKLRHGDSLDVPEFPVVYRA